MIDFDELVWMDKEDFLKEITQRMSAVRDMLNDIDVLISSYVNNKNMTLQEVAAYMRCEPANVPKEIPSVHVGRRWLYKQVEVDKWLRANTRSRKDIPDKLF